MFPFPIVQPTLAIASLQFVKVMTQDWKWNFSYSYTVDDDVIAIPNTFLVNQLTAALT